MSICKTCLRPVRTRWGSAQWHQRNAPGGYCSCDIQGIFSVSKHDDKPLSTPILSTAAFGVTVGQEVRLRSNVWESANEYSPGGLCGKRGDKLIVKTVMPETYYFPIAVHHPEVTNGNAFCVRADEIEPWQMTPNEQVCVREQSYRERSA